MRDRAQVGVLARWGVAQRRRSIGWLGALSIASACAPCPCGRSREDPLGRVAAGSGPAEAAKPASDDPVEAPTDARETASGPPSSELGPERAPEARAEDRPATDPSAQTRDPKTALLTQLGRLDEAASWTELAKEEIEGSPDRVIAFQRTPEELDDDATEEELPMVEVQVVAVTGDGSVYPLQRVEHRMYDCEDVSIYASPLKDAPQVVWLDVSCRAGEDFWSIEVDSSLHHRPAAGAWTRLWEGTQSVSGQWTACRDARELDVVVRDGSIVVDELRYRDYTPEPGDHVKRSDCPPKKLRRKSLAQVPVPAT